MFVTDRRDRRGEVDSRVTDRIGFAILGLTLAATMFVVGCQSPAWTPPSSPTAGRVPAGAPSGTAKVEGDVQRIAVDVSKGYYDPTVIEARSVVPLEISFGQGQGCLAQVLFPDFGVRENLISGGAVVKLPAMKPGTYEFSCGMRMVFGKIVVQ
jgi:hypothetical protein